MWLVNIKGSAGYQHINMIAYLNSGLGIENFNISFFLTKYLKYK